MSHVFPLFPHDPIPKPTCHFEFELQISRQIQICNLFVNRVFPLFPHGPTLGRICPPGHFELQISRQIRICNRPGNSRFFYEIDGVTLLRFESS